MRVVIVLALAVPALAACAASRGFQAEPPATIMLSGLERTQEAGSSVPKFVGHFVLKNRSQRNLCLMQDILQNELSPHVELTERIDHRRIERSTGLPHPPTTNAVAELQPGAEASFKRVVYYGEAASSSVRLRIGLRLWWCDGEGRLRLKSDFFSLEPIGAS